jgi:hypothetical protein
MMEDRIICLPFGLNAHTAVVWSGDQIEGKIEEKLSVERFFLTS